jgi:hypothetical protein
MNKFLLIFSNNLRQKSGFIFKVLINRIKSQLKNNEH